MRGVALPADIGDLRAGRIPTAHVYRIAQRMAETVLGNGLRDSPAPPAVQLAAERLIVADLDAAAWTVDAADILDRLADAGTANLAD